MEVESYGDGDEVGHGWVNATYNSNENIAWRTTLVVNDTYLSYEILSLRWMGRC